WRDRRVFLNCPSLLSVRADHRVKPSATFLKFHYLGPRGHRLWRPPLVEKFRLCICVPHHVARCVELLSDRNGLCLFVNNKFHIYFSSFCFFITSSTSPSCSKRVSQIFLYCSNHSSISFILF